MTVPAQMIRVLVRYWTKGKKLTALLKLDHSRCDGIQTGGATKSSVLGLTAVESSQ